MTNFVFDVAKGRGLQYGDAVNGGDSFVLLLLKYDGIEADSTMMKQETVADLLGSSTEQEMDRITLTGTGTATVIADTTSDQGQVGLVTPIQTWATSSGDEIAAVVVAYAPSTATDDGDLIPMTKHDCSFIPDGTDLEVNFGTVFYGAT